ncbi:MAG: hydantoinase B/oxoprolinase family protein [Chloroflexi bacterium]|nr:hydantoinase B/oxoprolinase family protein [Chloroflexota bacterium]
MQARMQHAVEIDAFTAEVIRSALVSITDEMKSNLMRTAYNQIIYEAEDFTVGLFDRAGNTISIGLGLPMFIRGLSDAIQAKLGYWGLDAIEPGDVLLTNDGYVMGSHLNHMIFTVPVFNDGELMAFASSMAHWPDVGGVLGGVTRDIYSEGLQLPFVKIYKRGIQDPELMAIIRANVRAPERAMGDFRAQIASIRTGERRLGELLRRYGNAAFDASVKQIFDQSERYARAAVRTIPDGVYEAESFMDDDAIAIGRHIPVRVRVTVHGDEMEIDLSGVGSQVAGYFNSGPTAGRSAAQVAFKFLTTPLLLPINDGSFRPVRIVLPPGRVISATKPAAMRWWMTIPQTVVDTIFKALAPACPERVIAGSHDDLASGGTYGYIDPRTGNLTVGSGAGVGLAGGGWGAKYDEDGMSATVCVNDGDTHNTPVEASEAKAPVVCVQRALRPDSGGPGRFRGGLGVVQQVELLTPAMYQSQIERTQCPPWGLLGGGDAMPNGLLIGRADGRLERFASGKVNPLRLDRGDSYYTQVGGGGGFGSPLERDPTRVLQDVRAGYVTIEAAEQGYGVIVRHSSRELQLDLEATLDLRRRRRSSTAKHEGERVQ